MTAMADAPAQMPAGPPADAEGRTADDPTKNVLDLVQAAILRQDDLRVQEIRHNRELGLLRAEHAKELADKEFARIDALAEKESSRIDAIRAVDVNAVQQAAQVSAQQATTLAAQVATSAEALRAQVQAAATAATIALAAALEPVQKDIADLRRAQYEAQGVDKRSEVTRDEGSNKSASLGVMIAGLAAVFAVLLGIIAIIVPLVVR